MTSVESLYTLMLSLLQNGILIPATVIDDLQSLLLAFLCNVANTCFLKKSSGLGASDIDEQEMQCNFIDAAITFCKLQHLNPTIPIKTQVRPISH